MTPGGDGCLRLPGGQSPSIVNQTQEVRVHARPPSVLVLETGQVLHFGGESIYTLEKCLGRGGMGEVWKATQTGAERFRQDVAIKTLRPAFSDLTSLEKHLIDEARVMAALHHPNVVRIYDLHKKEGVLFLVMDYVEGRSLQSLLELASRKGRRLSELLSCVVLSQVAEALHHAYQATDQGRPLHIVHRDVSPSNILIATTGETKLVDFGIAWSKLEGRVETDTLYPFKGKASYLSPEQVQKDSLDARTDQFALGSVLVEMVTGEVLFPSKGASWHRALHAITHVTPGYVGARTPGVSTKVKAVCQKLLAREPSKRFASGEEAARALRECVRGTEEGASAVRREVAELEGLPDVPLPDELPTQVAFRFPDKARMTRWCMALVTAIALAGLATFALASWYVPSHAVVPSSSALQGPAVFLPAPPVSPPPNGPLIGKPEKDGAAVAAGPTHRRKVVLADQKARIPLTVTASPAQRRTDEVVDVSLGSDERTARQELVAAQSRLAIMTAKYVKVSGEELSPQHALAALFATGNAHLAHFYRASYRRLTANGVSASVAIWKPRADDDSGTVAVVVDLANPDDAPPWEPTEGRIVRSDVRSSSGSPAALRAMPRAIPPGQRGRVAVVFNQSVIGEKAMVEILRGSRPEFAIEVSSQDLEPRESVWPF